jgi:hypothetical protein
VLAGQCLRIVKDAASVTIPLRGSRVTRERPCKDQEWDGSECLLRDKDGWALANAAPVSIKSPLHPANGRGEVEDKEKETEVERRWGSARERPRGMIEASSV